MVSFARARTRSLLHRLWPLTSQSIPNEEIESERSKECIDKISEQNRSFFEASKYGGMWFS